MEKDLTTGNITPQLIRFTIPLVLGNIFQLMYNAIDSIIVGRFVGSHALAAVGICNPISTLFILFLNGLCMGASILMGNMFGAKEYDKLHRQISTTMLSGIIFLLLCLFLYLIRTPDFITDAGRFCDHPYDKALFKNYFSGLIFTFMYNCFASTLRALGDSKSPLYFLIISSVVNVFGDLIFVLVFHMGSEGCAISTVLSEAISCLLCIIYIQKKVPILRLGKKWLVFDPSLLKQTISYGWASAMQQATVQLGKLGVQSIVNSMGVFVSAAFAAVNRIDDFAYMPQQNIAHAMTALMAQYKGAKKTDRIKAAFRCGMKIEIFYGIFIFFVCFFFAHPLMQLFSNDPVVCKHGVTYLKLISLMYLFPAVTNGVQGYFRGIGDLKVTLISSFVNMSVRVVFAAVLVFHFSLQIEALPFSYL
ncbi:MAG: MATE family efflux transporter, partial [Anaerostipes hadrus]